MGAERYLRFFFSPQTKPYLIEEVNLTSGHITYKGFIVDLMDDLAAYANFKYKIRTVQDGMFGSKREDGNWTGMIGEIVSKVILIRFLITIQKLTKIQNFLLKILMEVFLFQFLFAF